MTRAEAFEILPHTTKTYVLLFVVFCALALGEVYAHPAHPVKDHWAHIPLTIMLMSVAFYLGTRFLAPVPSAKLSQYLSRSGTYEIALKILSFFILIFTVVGWVRGIRSELNGFGHSVFFSLFLLADIYGKQSPYERPATPSVPSVSTWRDSMKPIQSSHWGER